MNVLSIDFDIIMAPSIDLYNGVVPSTHWGRLLRNPQLALCYPDCKIYRHLIEYIFYVINQGLSYDNIHFIDNHGQILNYISETEKIDLINIDHHHDCGYMDHCNDTTKINCANWVKYLYNNNQINSYLWLSNENSTNVEKHDTMKDIVVRNNFLEYPAEQLPKIDKLIICLSRPWVPPNYHDLFITIKAIIEQMAGRTYEFNLDNFEENTLVFTPRLTESKKYSIII